MDKSTHDLFSSLFPILQSSLAPFNFSIPSGILNVLNDFLSVIDTVYSNPRHGDTVYGGIEHSFLDYYPNWPMKRGKGRYEKDGRGDNMQCSRKDTDLHPRLTPGLLLFTCSHRVVYGFTILKSSESPRHVFDVLVTRMNDGEMPRIVVYDNACHLSAYCLAREPSRFSGTSMMVDRFHSVNHKTCSRSLHLRGYKGNEYLSKLNSQCCEQTNARLRDIGNILPFMALPKFRKALILFLARNQPRKK
ncbi:hypothetical protein PFISCL1PPCAC_15542 [Pristionchus fissidentatus]|uniref:Uncharacterized protein n=1 Tax=Pristionchus fissidentatus TaxID=1538716 RepID=A0AAV5VXH4_9BILA|nr:hypothetical protein PFISCL1PPCAC_15542 [Pristionchus fissidentatus]